MPKFNLHLRYDTIVIFSRFHVNCVSRKKEPTNDDEARTLTQCDTVGWHGNGSGATRFWSIAILCSLLSVAFALVSSGAGATLILENFLPTKSS